MIYVILVACLLILWISNQKASTTIEFTSKWWSKINPGWSSNSSNGLRDYLKPQNKMIYVILVAWQLILQTSNQLTSITIKFTSKKTIKKNPRLTVQFQKWRKRAPWNKMIFNAIFVAWWLMLLTHNGIWPNGVIRFVEISYPWGLSSILWMNNQKTSNIIRFSLKRWWKRAIGRPYISNNGQMFKLGDS